MKYNFSSSFKAIIFNLKIEYLLTPWNLTIDFDEEILELQQRNWFLIGFKVNSVSLRFIRSININEHFYGADIFIRTMGQNLTINYLEKSDALKIKNMLLEFNKGKAKKIIIA